MSKKSKTSKTNNDIHIEGLSFDDPLDYMGIDNNFLNNQQYSEKYKILAEAWSQLPLYQNKDKLKDIFHSIINNQVTIIVSGTGSGKTVIIPKLLLKYFMITNKNKINDNPEDAARYNSKIVITNPKILTTVYNADYSAATLDVPIGTYVGYKFRGSPDNASGPDVKLLYATDGLLLAQIYSGDVLLSEYQGVIIDEAHERGINIDLLLYFFKHVVRNRPEFKVIIMSATIDVEIFRKFYEDDGITYGHVEISGKSNYPIMSIYMQPNDKINLYNYLSVGISIILKLLEENKEGDILMFVPSVSDLEKGCNDLRTACPNKIKVGDICDSYYCAEISSGTNEENKELAISKDKYKLISPKFNRKIVFATNVAESSITLDGIVYVIDSGLENRFEFNFEKYAQTNQKTFTTQAQIKQRMGRAGRTQPGTCYHLYTEQQFNGFEKYPKPSIATANLNAEFISFMKNQKFLTNTIDLCQHLITPLTPQQLISAIKFSHFNRLFKIVKLNTQNGGNSDSDSVSDSDSTFSLSKEDNSDEDSLDVSASLTFKMIPYEKFNKYDSLSSYQGSLTRLGNIINQLQGYPIELGLLCFYGKLLSLPMVYSLVAILTTSNYNVNSLIRIPNNLKSHEKNTFITENFPNALSDNYSEHLFFYSLLTNYYELGNNLELLNLPVFEKVAEIQNIFSKKLDRINYDDYVAINKKYELIPSDINIDDLELMEKLYFAIFLSYRFNTIRLIDTSVKPLYKTQFFNDNSSVTPSFNFGKQLTNEDANNYSWGICSGISLSDKYTNVNGCTLIPNKYSEKFIKYYM